jgi:hypothetical protein
MSRQEYMIRIRQLERVADDFPGGNRRWIGRIVPIAAALMSMAIGN